MKSCHFLGPKSEYIVSGSDSGRIWIWEKATGRVVNVLLDADNHIVNVISPHPHQMILASCGIDSNIKIWEPTAEHPNLLQNLEDLLETRDPEDDVDDELLEQISRVRFFDMLLHVLGNDEDEDDDGHRTGSDASGDEEMMHFHL